MPACCRRSSKRNSVPLSPETQRASKAKQPIELLGCITADDREVILGYDASAGRTDCGFDDASFEEVGAKVIADRATLLSQSDIVLRLHKPTEEEIDQLKDGCIHVSYLDPFNENVLVDKFTSAKVTSISMEMMVPLLF